MYYVGIDMGSTATKVVAFEGEELKIKFSVPAGWNSVETSENIKNKLQQQGVNEENSKIVATGYGRISVPYAHKTITEITCHGKGANYLYKGDCTVIDVGGQDTKVITVQKGMVTDFLMNDKCSAGTGRFLEIMANKLGVDLETLCRLSKEGSGVTISSMCTVFAESEVISLVAKGKRREDIAYAIVDSIVSKVKSLCYKHSSSENYFFTGGLSGNKDFVDKLSEKLQKKVETHPLAKYAGAIGAALSAKKI
ncbi:acyl-CoA dehydratase activase [Haloimpatiens lingqiaonensis]|uniref:acyl-CoA dehydratase activase n=1 Tax=Haloimpatiens lingqiaonensis TaxID=1380675 RepID=UPI0010FD1B83|nr:acyl-CoA dehydratase activase [Haloimpatiens lingqiaonensis]